jgi:hypothetical protein
MYTKKEIIITILLIAFFTLLIVGLPQLEKVISGRKTYDYKREETTEKQVEKYICTSSVDNDILTSIKEATFYITEDKVTRIYTKESKTYKNKQDFTNASKTLEDNVTTDDLETKSTVDEVNWTIILVRAENITDQTVTDYPTTNTALAEYLEQNEYTCTIRYKS